MPNQSRYNEIQQRRSPHKKRTIRVYGSGEDSGKWYKCWNCGFINNIDRNAVGDGDGRSYFIGILPNETNKNVGFEMSVSGKDVLMSANPTGQEKHNIGMQAIAGCSFCGCMNYR